MVGKILREGGVWLAAGLLCSSINSLIDRFAGPAPVASRARGLFDGLAAVAFGAAIHFLVQRAQTRRERERET